MKPQCFFIGRGKGAVILDYIIKGPYLATFADPLIQYNKTFLLQHVHRNHQ